MACKSPESTAVAVPTWVGAVALGLGLAHAGPVLAQNAASADNARIYVCTDAEGRNHTADRPIRACLDREQRILNADGSLRGVLLPPPTPRERAERQAREQRDAERAAALADAARRERNLLVRYPDETAHQASRRSALEPIRLAMELSTTRLAQLASERKPLDEQLQALAGKPMPPALRVQLDANDAAVSAQQNLTRSQQAEFDRISRAFDRELEVLRRLWGGARPGTAEAAAPAAWAQAGGTAAP